MDDGNGFLYMRARYYMPQIKRFINADILRGNIANPETLNRYVYANGNPVSYIDPFGLSASAAHHMVLDAFGFAPGIGMAFDLANGIWYFTEGIHQMAFCH